MRQSGDRRIKNARSVMSPNIIDRIFASRHNRPNRAFAFFYKRIDLLCDTFLKIYVIKLCLATPVYHIIAVL
jgi:hypothetical protein